MAHRDDSVTPAGPDPAANRLGPGKVRASFYMSKDVADQLAAEVGRIHHGSGGRFTKAEVLDQVALVGLRHLDEVQDRLEKNAGK